MTDSSEKDSDDECVFVHISAGTIRDDVKVETVPDACCGEPVGFAYGQAGGGLGVYYFCTGKCERIFKRDADLEPSRSA